MESVKGTLCIVTSSFGEGEPPADAKGFKDTVLALSAKEFSTSLDFRYAVYGLGSSSYADTYQAFPRFVDSKLLQLGARRIVPLGESDDCAPDIAEKTFDSWMKTLAIAIEVGTESSAVSVDTESSSQKFQNLRGYKQLQVTANRPFFTSDILASDEALSQSTYHVELSSTDGGPLTYSEGDHISVLPTSTPQSLQAVAPFLKKWGNEVRSRFRMILTVHPSLTTITGYR